jgi:hypothetical protein
MYSFNLNHYLYIFGLLLISACNSPKKGCNDLNAVNYSFDADEPCEANLKEGDCPCVYPNLLLNFYPQHTFKKNGKDTIVKWNKDSILVNEFQQSYLIKSFSFFISNLQIKNSADQSFTVTDSSKIPILGSNNLSTISNNLVLLQSTSGTLTIGTFKETGTFKSLDFNVGLSYPENSTDILSTKMPIHPLNNTEMYRKEGLYSGKIIYQLGVNSSIIDTLTFTGIKSVSVNIPQTKKFEIAKDAFLILNFDCQKIFNNVNFGIDSKTVIETKVLDNFQNAFSIGG